MRRHPDRLPGRPWRVGLSAHLDNAGSAHTRTFERAVAWAQPGDHASCGIAEFHLACDGAAGDSAQAVARQFVEAGVDVVVGHYASAAAARAAPIYERAGIPLLLPAASAPELTRHDTTFRLCPSDEAILGRALAHIARQHGGCSIAVENDHRDSSRALARAARAAIVDTARIRLEADVRAADALFYVGRLHDAVVRVRELGSRLPADIMLSDDCVHPAMARELGELGRTAIAFGMHAPAACGTRTGVDAADQCVLDYTAAHGQVPGVYFLETCAAVQIALALACRRNIPGGVVHALAGHRWHTVLGPVEFVRRENVHARTASWLLDRHGVHLADADFPCPQAGPRS